MDSPGFTTRPTLQGSFGMVSSTHWIASTAAMGTLERGGNAFDAAVCAGFVLHVVEPHLNGPGGDLPAIVSDPSGRGARVLCGQGPAPAGATVEHFAGHGLDLVPGAGPLATAVPGAFDAWMLLLRDRGSMSPAEVLGPARHYAQHGVPVLPAMSRTVDAVRELFTQHWPTSAQTWLVRGRAPVPGTLFRNPLWARTLDRLLAAGETGGASREGRIDAVRRAWSSGFVAEAIERFARIPHRHSCGRVLPGVITGADCAAYRARWEEPATLDFRGHQIAKTGAWAQGPALLQVLQMLGEDPVAPLDTAAGVHEVVERFKLALADREAWYGDSARQPPPLDDLLAQSYARSRARLVGPRASHEVRPGAPGGRRPRMAARALATDEAGMSEDASTGEPTVPQYGAHSGDTCHVDVVDRWGNMIAATPSGGWLQSSPVVGDLGFALGSRLQMMWLEPGLPSSLVPGARPRSTLSPTLVLREDTPVLACGSPGGDQQDQWQAVFLLRHLVEGASLQEAIDAPTFHTTSFPGSFAPRLVEPGVLVAEDRLGAEVLQQLRDRGHRVRSAGDWALSRLCVVARDPHTGLLSAGANPRGMQGYAVGR
ncbi:MAG TPA: gamma-glutamyltransferase [Ornithinimicrobium sp.]|uniref:gamma-glutamyltransferase family protein n=1 Tax=Ornithinimicrobium sp. TaxID=1977084 RepID=UPI002B4A4BBB|nr:gamma-glutamyltransferase [Ornithinimicrobium sp.]HKJ10771.1 gamma-glutamyltransferase [Ornithinimicrobium sp.]